ncbi:hypothetical protein NADFUDRAFT_83201 [Nadsonia fulvescens var. elongata DSM 6958]|uniref:Uncharacterized protein n=1 Tax=Nadsonia fulvescens var. elongata DSM 6958 TaxID=857566 RepID=A0A1E3PI89_9ASCO|nr:hypothetical protein NADFUDRAFT_83201 [Nadsonia fulvescens var. elongata DSM 6958]
MDDILSGNNSDYNTGVDIWNEYAGEKFNTKDPFEEKLENGETRRRRAPEGSPPEVVKAWKRIQMMAWTHDRCCMGCYPVDLGFGLAPLVSIFPIIGPMFMYCIHAKLITRAEREFPVPQVLSAKLYSNILVDFLISITPVIGPLLAWLNACSTRNAAMIHTYLKKRAKEQQAQLGDFELVETMRPVNVLESCNANGRPPPGKTQSQVSNNRFQNLNVPTGQDQYLQSAPRQVSQLPLDTPPPQQPSLFSGERFKRSKLDPNAKLVAYKPTVGKPGRSGAQESGVI